MTEPAATTPIVCDMTGAPDTPMERLAEYQRLFAGAFTAKERTPTGIRFRLRSDPGLEDQVRDLAAREKACCAFFDFDIANRDGEIWWDWSVIDDDIARGLLDEIYQLPETAAAGIAAVQQRFLRRDLIVTTDDGTGGDGARPLLPRPHRRAR